jgi:hypothetical protein
MKGEGTRLSDYYQQDLSDKQAAELLDTIIHEAIHWTFKQDDWRQSENDDKGTGYPYEEARRRTTQALIDRLNRERKQEESKSKSKSEPPPSPPPPTPTTIQMPAEGPK